MIKANPITLTLLGALFAAAPAIVRADQIKPGPTSPFSDPNSPITLPPIDLRVSPDSANPFGDSMLIEPAKQISPETRPAVGIGSARSSPVDSAKSNPIDGQTHYSRPPSSD